MRSFLRYLYAGGKTRVCAIILTGAVISFPSLTVAVEGGGSHWIMGSTGFGAGGIPKPGFHYTNLLWFMDVSTEQDLTLGTNRVNELKVETTSNIFLPTIAGRIDAWNAKYNIIGVLPFVWLDGRFRVVGDKNVKDRKNYNLGDPAIDMQIGWHKDDFLGYKGLSLDYKPGLLVITPWGKYERSEVLNTGKYRWHIQPNFSYTLLHEPTGIELSQRIMYGFSIQNDRTKYKSGQEFHFDWVLGKRFGDGWQAGLFGYWYRQVTGDSGRGATLGDFKGKAWGIGPLVQYSSEIAGVPITGALRYQRVFQHRNRIDDTAAMLHLSVSF